MGLLPVPLAENLERRLCLPMIFACFGRWETASTVPLCMKVYNTIGTQSLPQVLRDHGVRNTGRYLVTMSLDLGIALRTTGGGRVRFFFCSQPLKSLYASISGRASIVTEVVNY